MKKVYFKQAIGLLLIGSLTACFIESCKERSLASVKAKGKKSETIIILPLKRDTLPKSLGLTEEQRQILFEKFGNLIVKKYVKPEFDKLGGVITNQTMVINRLSISLDSVIKHDAKEQNLLISYRNRSIARVDSMQQLLNARELRRDQRDSLREMNENKRRDLNIETNKRIIDSAMVSIVIIFIFMAVLAAAGIAFWFYVRRMFKKLIPK